MLLVILIVFLININYSINGEFIKALVGENVQLECPSGEDATWFFRSIDKENEDLIVTRHGIITAPYKKKLTCLTNINHKTIIVNKIQINDEGTYTCLYSINTDNWDVDAVSVQQQRYKFNVSVYTLIDGLSMSIKSSFNNQELKTQDKDNDESVLKIREHDEVIVTCLVEKSKPPAIINFSLGNEKPMSIVSLNTNTFKNEDKTYKTIYTIKLKANLADQGKLLSCNAHNTISNQKWENRRILDIQYVPQCEHQKGHQFYVGINQTTTIECRIKKANPNIISFDWHLTPSMNHYNLFIEKIKFHNEGFSSKFKYTPRSIDDFGKLVCKASNEIGSNECLYELKLGGIPNPPFDCTYYLKNSSAIIFCQLGFHQGDPDIYCYLLRKADNGVFKEHTRSRDSCSFIVNDVSLDRLNEFWIYSSNKYGHNKDVGVHLSIGETQKLINEEKVDSKMLIMLGAGCGALVLMIILCCICINTKNRYNEDFDLINDKATKENINYYDDKTSFKQTYYDKEPNNALLIIKNQNYDDIKTLQKLPSTYSLPNKMVTFTNDRKNDTELYSTINKKQSNTIDTTNNSSLDEHYVTIKAQNDDKTPLYYDNIQTHSNTDLIFRNNHTLKSDTSSHNLGILV